MQHIKELDVSKLKAVDGCIVAICFSNILNAEGVTRPHCRNPPLRKDRLQKLGQAILKARSPLFKDDGEDADRTDAIGNGDLFIALDGSRVGNHTKLVNWIKGPKITRNISLFHDDDTIKERKFRAKGVGTMCMTETLLLTSCVALKLPEFKYESVPGGSKGSAFGLVKVVAG